jgi:hypothetical protein
MLCINFNVFNNPFVIFIYILLMFSNCLKMFKIDRNMSELWHIELKEYNINISGFVAVIVRNIFDSDHPAGWRTEDLLVQSC